MFLSCLIMFHLSSFMTCLKIWSCFRSYFSVSVPSMPGNMGIGNVNFRWSPLLLYSLMSVGTNEQLKQPVLHLGERIQQLNEPNNLSRLIERVRGIIQDGFDLVFSLQRAANLPRLTVREVEKGCPRRALISSFILLSPHSPPSDPITSLAFLNSLLRDCCFHATSTSP